MRTLSRLFIALAALGLAIAPSSVPAAADKPLVMESGKVKQLPASTTIQINASGTGAASINIPHGTAPSSPNNGDCWTTTGGLYCRINGATVGPYSTGGAIASKDEGSTLSSATTSVDYVGAGVTATNVGGAITVTIPGGSGGTVTTTGSPASGNLAKFSGATSVTNGDLSGDVTTSGALATTIANDAVSYAKMQNVSAASKLLGRGDSGSGDPQEITIGTGLTMTGTTLSASGGGGSSITAKDEGSTLTTGMTSIDFVGSTVTATNSSGAVTVTVADDLGVFHAYDEKASGTNGGGSTANTWTKRDLNTTELNTISGASLSSNEIILPAGTYDFWASAPTYDDASYGSTVRLYNVTDSAVIMLGTSQWGVGNHEQRTFVQGRFTLSGTKHIAVYSFHSATQATNGLGVNAGFTGVANHFTDILIKRVG